VYTTAASKNKQGIQKSSGDTCYSVENKPLRTLKSLDSSLPPDPLHLFEGFVNHLNKETHLLLKKEVAGGGWINKAFNVKEIVEEATKMKSDIENTKDYLSAKHKLLKIRKRLEAVYGKINEQVENETTDENTDDLIRERDMLIEEMHKIDVASSVGFINCRVKGLKNLIMLLDNKNGEINIDQLDEGEFVFKHATRTFGGKFNKQHGGFDLTAGRCFKLLKNRDKVVDLVSGAYKNDEAKKTKMNSIMEWWSKCAEYLFVIGKLMYSQKKMT